MYGVRTIKITLEKPTQEFIESLEERTGTPANEICAAIINGHLSAHDLK